MKKSAVYLIALNPSFYFYFHCYFCFEDNITEGHLICLCYIGGQILTMVYFLVLNSTHLS